MVFFSGTLLAQQSSVYTHDLIEFNRAIELYKDKQYQAAQILFDKVKSKTIIMEVESDCAYYIANLRYVLNQMGADVLVEAFVEDYPTSTKKIKLILKWHIIILTKEIILKSLEWFDKSRFKFNVSTR